MEKIRSTSLNLLSARGKMFLIESRLSRPEVLHKEAIPVQEVNPWEVKGDADGKIDYEKLQKKVWHVQSMECCQI